MSLKVPIVPGKLGNTRQISPAKNWVFTLNNYTVAEVKTITEISKELVPRYVFQEEVGECGTPHLQGFIEFTTKKRPFSVFKNKRIHWEKCKNVKASITYCQKNDTCVGQKYFRGIQRPYVVEISKMYDWQKYIIELIQGPICERSLYWFYEKVGCAGKTTIQKYIFTHFDNVLICSGKAADMKHAVVEYINNKKLFPEIILCNIPRASLDYISWAGIEEVKDMFFHSGKYEGGQVCGPSPHFLIFANEKPDMESVSADRWKITNLAKYKM